MIPFLFYLFAGITLLAALFVVLSRDAVNSAMCMIAAFVGVAALFVLLEAYFLAALQVIVYAGAVMVLFLFIIMLLDTEARKRVRLTGANLLAGIIGVLIVAAGAYWLSQAFPVGAAPAPAPLMPPEGNPLGYATAAKAYGYGLFTRYMLAFQVTGFLLLIAMVGIIVLSKRPPAAANPAPVKS